MSLLMLPTDEEMSWSALARRFWTPLDVWRNCAATSSSALTTADCSETLLGVPAKDDSADSSDASEFASEVPVVELPEPLALPKSC